MHRIARVAVPFVAGTAALALTVPAVAAAHPATTSRADATHSVATRVSAGRSGVVHGLHVDPHLLTLHGRSAATQQSENWSGYIKDGSGLTNSTASWTVPTLSTQDPGYSSTWVGIDGASSSDQYLIQTGTEQDVENGQASYDAWWEVITPSDEAPETIYSNLTIKPGDAITASVKEVSAGTWTMSLTDTTTGQSASHTASYAGPGESAEWIQEDTDVDDLISAAPDWHSVTFHGITVNGANPALTSSEAVDIVDAEGTQEDTTSNPNSTTNGFTVTWDATGAPDPTL